MSTHTNHPTDETMVAPTTASASLSWFSLNWFSDMFDMMPLHLHDRWILTQKLWPTTNRHSVSTMDDLLILVWQILTDDKGMEAVGIRSNLTRQSYANEETKRKTNKVEANSKCVKSDQKAQHLYLLFLPAHPKQKRKCAEINKTNKIACTFCASSTISKNMDCTCGRAPHLSWEGFIINGRMPSTWRLFARSPTFENDIKSLKGLNPFRNNARKKNLALPGAWVRFLCHWHASFADETNEVIKLYHDISFNKFKDRQDHDRPYPWVQCIKMRKLREGTLSQCRLPKVMKVLHALDPEKFS